MDLKTAILRAARFAAKEKSDAQEPYKLIRFLPPSNATDITRVFATNGTLGILLTLDRDVEVQNACASASLCAQMARGSDYIARMDWAGAGLEFTARRKKGMEIYKYRLPAGNVSLYPSFQTLPLEMVHIPDWDSVYAAAHAANESQGEDNVVFRCVHFTPRAVESTDHYRLARTAIAAPWSGLVPCELFSHWPSGNVYAGFTALYAFFRIGDEVRYSHLMHGKYPDTQVLVPEIHRGHEAICPVDQLAAAVKQAAKMTKTKVVCLDFKDDLVKVSSWTHREDEKFHTNVRAEGAIGAHVLLSGGDFLEALQVLRTPRVFVGYGSNETDLFRLESGNLTVALWPHVEPKKEAINGQDKSRRVL